MQLYCSSDRETRFPGYNIGQLAGTRKRSDTIFLTETRWKPDGLRLRKVAVTSRFVSATVTMPRHPPIRCQACDPLDLPKARHSRPGLARVSASTRGGSTLLWS
jgi:hypothetical protein